MRAALAAAAAGLGLAAAGAEFVREDPRWTLTRFAEAPDIVTPIGAACDARGRLFVIESHTHLRPPGYAGPELDRILVFTDADDDGRADARAVFAEGLPEAMGCAFGPDGALYVAGADAVWRLADTTGDGRADTRRELLTLETAERYPHNKLLSLAFGPDGRLYLGRGNTGGFAWTLRGRDGSAVSGYGDGGNILRARADGSEVELFAAGFWNPFGLAFDLEGRLLAADNDPDARGPNRLVHVVRGGDYGHRHLYGGGGNHPLQAWNGELPGTLPFLSGTGEAPGTLLDTRRLARPADFADGLLVAVWGEHTLEHHRTRPRGTSLAAGRSALLRGPADFRPTALAADARGRLYVTDWVRVDYPNHGEGRIWRIAARRDAGPVKEPATAARVPADAGLARLSRLLDGPAPGAAALRAALRDDDPFLRHAAVMRLAEARQAARAERWLDDADPRVRLGALLARRRAGVADPAPLLRRALADADPEIRLAALRWAADEAVGAVRDDLPAALDAPGLDARLFEAWLAALECVQPAFVEAFRRRAAARASHLPRRLPPEFLPRFLADDARPAALRALAVPRLDEPARHAALLRRLAATPEPALQLEAIRSLAAAGDAPATDLFAKLAADGAQPAAVRAEALTALEGFASGDPALALRLLRDADAQVAAAAAGLLAHSAGLPEVRAALDAVRRRPGAPARLREAAGRALGIESGRPATLAQWEAALAEGGDPAAGARVFFSARAGCAACHRFHGRGARFGPDLSGLGRSAPRAKIVRAILRPSEEFAPQWQTWEIETRDGEVLAGLQLHPKSGGAYDLELADGVRRFGAAEIAAVRAAPRSLMPDGLEAGLTVSELRDLAAMLAGD